jgi:hypothetical protein
MTEFTNLFGIDLSMAVWLVHDDYDFVPKENALSATGLLKPTRQIILGTRLAQSGIVETEDLSSRISMKLGHAIHDSIEQAWKKGYKQNLASLGIPQKVIDRVKINPNPGDVVDTDLPVYIEVRGTREIGAWRISGKLDMAIDGRLKDIKSTSVYTYIKGRKDEDYRLQGSIYKWLHADKITDQEMDVQFVFKDWMGAMVNSTPGYPATQVVSYTVPLYTDEETENWIENKLDDLERYMDAPQEALPRCTDEELWRTDPVWKYFADGSKTDGKSTKNFDDPAEANRHLASKGKGVVINVPGKVKACSYCRAFQICTQKDEYEHV